MFDPNVVLKTPVNSDDDEADDDEEDDVEPPLDIERNFGEFMEFVDSQVPPPPRQMLPINPHNSGM